MIKKPLNPKPEHEPLPDIFIPFQENIKTPKDGKSEFLFQPICYCCTELEAEQELLRQLFQLINSCRERENLDYLDPSIISNPEKMEIVLGAKHGSWYTKTEEKTKTNEILPRTCIRSDTDTQYQFQLGIMRVKSSVLFLQK